MGEYSISWKPLRFALWFPTLISCSPNLPCIYIRLCKHGNHFTFLQYKTYNTLGAKPVRVPQQSPGLYKQQATLQLCIRADGEQKVKPPLILREKGRVATEEKEK